MAKLLFVVFSIWLLDSAIGLPTFTDKNTLNGQPKYDLSEDRRRAITSRDSETIFSDYPANGVQAVPLQLSQQRSRSGRKKRSFITSGVCPAGQVWKPRPFYCITCAEYEELSGNDC